MKTYLTLLSTKNYLDGVLALHSSLKSCKSEYPLHCLLSESIDQRIKSILDKNGIPYIQLEQTIMKGVINGDKHYSHWNFTFDKLHVWGLAQFEKIVFLDCDMIVLKNIDHLFSCESFTAVCAGHSSPGCEHWVDLNSGLMVITPCKKTEHALVELGRSYIKQFQEKNQSIGDQDIINKFIPEWKDLPLLHLDEGYNLFASQLTYYAKHLGYSISGDKGKPIYVIHFIGRTKPWMLMKSFKSTIWLIYQILRNPLYLEIFFRYKKLLKQAVRNV